MLFSFDLCESSLFFFLFELFLKLLCSHAFFLCFFVQLRVSLLIFLFLLGKLLFLLLLFFFKQKLISEILAIIIFLVGCLQYQDNLLILSLLCQSHAGLSLIVSSEQIDLFVKLLLNVLEGLDLAVTYSNEGQIISLVVNF